MADDDVSLVRAKRKVRSGSGHDDGLPRPAADPVPLLTPSKRYPADAASPSSLADASSPLVIARSPSDTSKLWATRIAATQRIASRHRSAGGAHSGDKTSAARRRALSLSPAAASFEASVSITTSLVVQKATSETPRKTPPKRRRASTSRSEENQSHDGDDVDMAEDDDEPVSTITPETEDETVADSKAEPGKRELRPRRPKPTLPLPPPKPRETRASTRRRSTGRGDKYEQQPVAGGDVEMPHGEDRSEQPPSLSVEEPELLECKVKVEPDVAIKEEQQRTKPPLEASPSRRRPRLAATEPVEQETTELSSQDVEALTERLAALAASLATEQAEKAALKQEVDALASRLRESEEAQQRLASQVASLTAALVTVKEETA